MHWQEGRWDGYVLDINTGKQHCTSRGGRRVIRSLYFHWFPLPFSLRLIIFDRSLAFLTAIRFLSWQFSKLLHSYRHRLRHGLNLRLSKTGQIEIISRALNSLQENKVLSTKYKMTTWLASHSVVSIRFFWNQFTHNCTKPLEFSSRWKMYISSKFMVL